MTPLPIQQLDSPLDLFNLPSDVIAQFEEFAAPLPTLLNVHLANLTAYYQDTVDLKLLAQGPMQPDPINTATLANNNFMTLEVVGDIVGINDDLTVRGLYLSKNLVTRSSPTATAGSGTMISDVSIFGAREDRFKFLRLHPDPTVTKLIEIGSITAAGVSGQPESRGEPSEITGGDWAITGGTGAFLGVTGQMGGEKSVGTTIRAASVQEDPSQRRINASPNDTGTMGLYVFPMMPPQIIRIFHDAPPWDTPPFNWALVTPQNPAKVGEKLIMYATGLGPVLDQYGNDVPIGTPFPANATVISPVTIIIGNVGLGNTKSTFAPQSVQPIQGFNNGYQVEFILPDVSNLAIAEATSIQISSAWIQSAAATLYIAGGGGLHP